jgi:septal ring factor EnvC (AmiA/AmiB activator)
MTTEQLPEGLNMAVAHIEELRGIIATRYADHTGEVHPSRVRRTAMEVASCDEAIDAIRAEHQQRVTLQHRAADQAQRIAKLEAENSKFRAWLAESNERAEDFAGRVLRLDDENEDLKAERDDLRARLDAMERQEPVAEVLFGGFIKGVGLVIRPGCVVQQFQPLYARPVPAQMPEMLVVSMAPSSAYAQGWNDCRAKMLSAAPEAAG